MGWQYRYYIYIASFSQNLSSRIENNANSEDFDLLSNYDRVEDQLTLSIGTGVPFLLLCFKLFNNNPSKIITIALNLLYNNEIYSN